MSILHLVIRVSKEIKNKMLKYLCVGFVVIWIKMQFSNNIVFIVWFFGLFKFRIKEL